ncbi:calcium-binding protein, partial [Yoonia sp.]|uniref:calcium-binding protein n=1 Tax=Yoonia sp. TaxID=2212373 RepID=UPI00273FB4D2
GGDGDDALNGGDGDDLLMGDSGNDTMLGSMGDDVLFGGAGADTLHGGPGNDLLFDRGDDRVDFLNGGAGNDILMGDHGDILNGGTGADIFSLIVQNNAVVEDYDAQEDRIEIVYQGDPPNMTTKQTDAGLILLADGEIIATFPQLFELDTGSIVLQSASSISG